MKEITIQIDDATMANLQDISEKSGLSIEELVSTHIHEISQDNGFQEAKKYVLEKNKELYDRLA